LQESTPNFFVIGAMRSATTSLCEILSLHPQVFMSKPKELNFFSNNSVFCQGWNWYRDNFAAAHAKAAIGEGSTNYTKQSLYPRAAERLAEYCPNARLIYIVRHPLQRIESHWLHMLRMGIDPSTLAEALRLMPDMLDISLYWKQIDVYRRLFPDDRILVLFLEDLIENPGAVIARCCEFLRLAPVTEVTGARVHSNGYADVPIDGKILRLLRRIPGIQGLARTVPLRAAVRLLKRPPPAPSWPADLRAQIVDQLAPDSGRFLDFYGKPPNFWPLN